MNHTTRRVTSMHQLSPRIKIRLSVLSSLRLLQTAQPVEQTKQQAPLTNPPQQIIAPSPVSIPEPQTQGVGLTGTENSASGAALPKGSVSPSPAASLSPAMQAALKKASPSPSSSPATRGRRGRGNRS